MILVSFIALYNILKVKEFTTDISVMLPYRYHPCFDDLEKQYQFPYQNVLEGPDVCVLWIFILFFILYAYEFAESISDIPTIIYIVTSKIQVSFLFRKSQKVLIFAHFRVAKVLSYHVLMTTYLQNTAATGPV